MSIHQNPTDDDLALGIQNGSEQAFNLLYKKFEGKLMGYLYMKLKNKEIAEEIFQITWSKVLKNIHRYKLGNNFSAWLFTITNNSAKDWFKKSSNQYKLMESLRQEPNDSTLIEKEPLELSFLKSEAKKVIELQYIHGFSSREISKKLNLSESNVRKISSRAKKQIKSYILDGGNLS